MHPEALSRTRYLLLHVPHVCKSLLLPLKMGLEGQGQEKTQEKRESAPVGRSGASRGHRPLSPRCHRCEGRMLL